MIPNKIIESTRKDTSWSIAPRVAGLKSNGEEKQFLVEKTEFKGIIQQTAVVSSVIQPQDYNDDSFDENIEKVVDLCLNICVVSVPLVRYFVPQFYLWWLLPSAPTIWDSSHVVTLAQIVSLASVPTIISGKSSWTKGRCLLIKDIFSPACDYAGNVDLLRSTC